MYRFWVLSVSRAGDNLEALKPYVCDKPLCLYQYMSLGFGPSIEHEIISQPYVVDLLTTFCYHFRCWVKACCLPGWAQFNVPPSPQCIQRSHQPVAVTTLHTTTAYTSCHAGSCLPSGFLKAKLKLSYKRTDV